MPWLLEAMPSLTQPRLQLSKLLGCYLPTESVRVFDEAADGYARAEGIAAVVLRRAEMPFEETPWAAWRAPYACILAAATNCDGFTPSSINHPSCNAQAALMQKVCAKAEINPLQVVYVEAHGTGVASADVAELSAIDNVYGSGAGRSRDCPLLVGSIKSNMGHCEGASGLAGLIKALLALEHGMLPSNLHFQTPNSRATCLESGHIQVTTHARPFNGGVIGINSFGLGGTNVHVLIGGGPAYTSFQQNASRAAPKNTTLPPCGRPAVITGSGLFPRSPVHHTSPDGLVSGSHGSMLMEHAASVHREAGGHDFCFMSCTSDRLSLSSPRITRTLSAHPLGDLGPGEGCGAARPPRLYGTDVPQMRQRHASSDAACGDSRDDSAILATPPCLQNSPVACSGRAPDSIDRPGDAPREIDRNSGATPMDNLARSLGAEIARASEEPEDGDGGPQRRIQPGNLQKSSADIFPVRESQGGIVDVSMGTAEGHMRAPGHVPIECAEGTTGRDGDSLSGEAIPAGIATAAESMGAVGLAKSSSQSCRPVPDLWPETIAEGTDGTARERDTSEQSEGTINSYSSESEAPASTEINFELPPQSVVSATSSSDRGLLSDPLNDRSFSLFDSAGSGPRGPRYRSPGWSSPDCIAASHRSPCWSTSMAPTSTCDSEEGQEDGHLGNVRRHLSESDDDLAKTLIPLASRTEKGIRNLVKVLMKQPDLELMLQPMRQLCNTVLANPANQPFRATVTGEDIEWEHVRPQHANPPVWFVFSGDGSQWPLMAADLASHNLTFSVTWERCADVVAPFGIDLFEEMMASNGWSHPCNATVGLVAVQIALVDVLRKDYGIRPAGLVGHSAGEVACGYADGCLTLEEAMLVAYHRGRLAPMDKVKGGLMASVGLSAEEAEQRIHGIPDVAVACDDSRSNVVLAGRAQSLIPVLSAIKREGAFVREVKTSGVAYHSPAVAHLAPILSKALRDVLKEPKIRSSTWVSTCFPPGSTDLSAAYCCTEYHAASYGGRVLFRQACTAIPKDALLLEIGPHSQLKALLRVNCPGQRYVATLHRNCASDLSFSSAIADLWRKGVTMRWPVPIISPRAAVPRGVREALVAWDHSYKWSIPRWDDFGGAKQGRFMKTFDLGGEDRYLEDHVLDGQIVMPDASYLIAAWEAVAYSQWRSLGEVPVEWTDVHVHRRVLVRAGEKCSLLTLLNIGGDFQVTHAGDVVASGSVRALPPQEGQMTAPQARIPRPTYRGVLESCTNSVTGDSVTPLNLARSESIPPAERDPLSSRPVRTAHDTAIQEGAVVQDGVASCRAPVWPYAAEETISKEHIYQTFQRQGLTMGPAFCLLENVSADSRLAQVRWEDRWVPFLAGMVKAFEFCTYRHVPGHSLMPVRYHRITVHQPAGPTTDLVNVELDLSCRTARSAFAEVHVTECALVSRRQSPHKIVTTGMGFIPYGEHVTPNPSTDAYMAYLQGYAKMRLLPALQLFEDSPEFPPHLNKVAAIVGQMRNDAPPPSQIGPFLMSPSHRIAHLCNTLFTAENVEATMMDPRAALAKAEVDDGPIELVDPAALPSPHLQSMVDVALQNLPISFSAAEIGAGSARLSNILLPIMDLQLHSYLSTDKDPAVVGRAKDEARPSSKFTCQVWQFDRECLPSHVDIVIANMSLSLACNIEGALANIWSSLTPGGFLLFHEWTCSLPVALWGLDAAAWQFDDPQARSFGPWLQVSAWKRALSHIGFYEVFTRPASDRSTCTFLFRKPFPSGLPHPIVMTGPPLTSHSQDAQAWLETFRETLKAEKVGFRGRTAFWLSRRSWKDLADRGCRF
eukprot:jgi/Botrbrau1/15864/Bobra.40_1s0048.1